MSAWSYPGPLLLYASCRALLGLPFSLPGGFDDMFFTFFQCSDPMALDLVGGVWPPVLS